MDSRKDTYDEIIKKLENRKDQISIDFHKETVLIKEIIEESFYLHGIINEIHRTNFDRTGIKLDGPEALLHFLFHRNNHYLIASYKLALKGLNNPSYAILRSVFETILHSYMLHLTDEEAKLFFKFETNQLTSKEEREVNSKYQRFAPRIIRKLLYEGQKLEQIFEFYKVISTSTHPSIKHAFEDMVYDKETTEDLLWLLLSLGIANIMAFGEVYFDSIKPTIAKELEELIKRVALELDAYPDLIPNKPEYKDKLKLEIYSKP